MHPRHQGEALVASGGPLRINPRAHGVATCRVTHIYIYMLLLLLLLLCYAIESLVYCIVL